MDTSGTVVQTTVFCHFHDEEFLLPYWLRHHRRLFDHGVLVDRASTDRSVEILRELAPEWEVIPSRNPMLDARDCDLEMMDLESRYEGWKVVLNVTEFLFHDDLRSYLSVFERERPSVSTLALRTVTMVDRVEDRGAPITAEDLFFQRFHGYFNEELLRLSNFRFLHREVHGDYGPGRHTTGHHYRRDPNLLILKFSWCPYEQLRTRKLEIQSAVPDADVRQGMSFHHLATPEELDVQFLEQASWAVDLRTKEPYRSTLERLRARFGGEQADRPVTPPRAVRSAKGDAGGGRRIGVLSAAKLLSDANRELTAKASRLCRELRGEHEVQLLSPARSDDAASHGLRVGSCDVDDIETLDSWSDVLIVAPEVIAAFPQLLDSRKPIAIDLCGQPSTVTLDERLLMRADLFLFESAVAREPWIERLVAAGRIDPELGRDDPSLASLDAPGALRDFCRRPRRFTGRPVTDDTMMVSTAAYRQRYKQATQFTWQLDELLARYMHVRELHRKLREAHRRLQERYARLESVHRSLEAEHERVSHPAGDPPGTGATAP
jgi:hypothetical protein